MWICFGTAHITEAQEVDETFTIVFDATQRRQYLQPDQIVPAARSLQCSIKAWIVKDAQGLDTRVDLIRCFCYG